MLFCKYCISTLSTDAENFFSLFGLASSTDGLLSLFPPKVKLVRLLILRLIMIDPNYAWHSVHSQFSFVAVPATFKQQSLPSF